MEQKTSIENQISNILERLEQIQDQLSEKQSIQDIKNQWLDIQEVCQALKISKRTLQLYRQNGLLPGSKINGKVYIRAIDIQKLLEAKHESKLDKYNSYVRRR